MTMMMTSSLVSCFSGGDGSSASPFQISTPDDLVELRENVNKGNSYANTHFNLTTELNLEAASHIPIGLGPSTPFCGTFEGNHFYITSYTVEGPYEYAGFFGYLGTGAHVRDMNLGGHVLTNKGNVGDVYAGSVAGYALNAIVIDCHAQGNVNVSAANVAYVGGLVGYANGTRLNSLQTTETVMVAVIGPDGAYAGGIAGVVADVDAGDEQPISGCVNRGAVFAASERGFTMAAGIVAKSDVSITECDNRGPITSTFSQYGYAAGIACYMTAEKATVSYVINTGEIVTEPYVYSDGRTDYSYAAGIVGLFEKSGAYLISAHNRAHVTAYSTRNLYLYAAGVAGGLEIGATVSAAQNDGNVTIVADENSTRTYGTMGGLIGDAERGCVIINSHNAGPVRAVSNAKYSTFIMGGVAGELLSGSVVRNSFNTGDILSESQDPFTYEYIAGIAALVGTNSTIDNCYTRAHLAWSQSASFVDLDVVGALAGSSEDTYITNSYWLYSTRYKPIARGICDNCGSFDEYGVMIEDSMEPSFLYDALNKRIANATDYRTWVQGSDYPAEFDCKYFSHRTDACEAHAHCVLDNANECVYASCDTFEYTTCGAQHCRRCDVELKCLDPDGPLANDSCTECSSFADADSCSAAGNGRRCKWCEIGNKCIGVGFRCKAFRGAGTEEDPYEVATAADIMTLRQAVEGGITFEHVYFVQTADIDLGGAKVNPIGDETRQFRGTYDGQRHKVSGYTISGSYKYAGFFGYLGYEGLITNLRVSGTVETTMNGQHAYAGGIVGFAYANVVNCRNFGNVSAKAYGGYAYAGGIVGYAEFGAVAKTINTGKVVAASFNGAENNDAFAYAGGVAGYLVSDFYLEKCFNFGEVVANGNSSNTRIYAGGIAGYISHDNYVVNSLNMGNIIAESHRDNTGVVRAAAGGVAGECDYSNYVMNFGSHGNVTIVHNLTDDRAYTTSVAGGFFGATSYGNTMENSYATGFIYAWTSNEDDHDYSAIGGLIGIATRGSYVRNCYFSGDVVLDTFLSNYYSYAGALIGYSTYDSVEDCYWRFDPYLDSFGAGFCTNCASFDEYEVVARDAPNPKFLYQALNEYLGNHSCELPAVEFSRWVQGFSHALPAGFECSNFNTAADFCAGAEFCHWNPSGLKLDDENGETANENGTCEYRPCEEFPYDTCNAPQCHACDFSRVCIDASDNETACISCSVNTEEYTCQAIPVCHWCRVTQECISDTHMCVGYDGNGTEESPYIVRSIYDLRTIQRNVNAGVSYAGRYFKLINNLYLDDQEVEPIGTASNPFRGSFDGQGHIVFGYKITGHDHAYVGFFGYVGEGGVVRNFRVNGTMKVSSFHFDIFAGGIAGYAYRANISGCHNYGRVWSHSATGFSYAGGVVGYSDDSNVTGCYNTAPVTATGLNTDCYAGGVVAYSETDIPITHCFNDAGIDTAISSSYRSSHVGGIAGMAKNIVNCYNKGHIIVTADSDSFTFNGGIVGLAIASGYVRNCYSTGDIYVQSNKSFTFSYTGGIVGSTYGAEVHNCYTGGLVRDTSASATVGAVVGNAYHAANISRCFFPNNAGAATGINTTCTECSPFLPDGRLVKLGNTQVAVALNSTVTAANGYVHWVKPAEINQTAAFECAYFTSITSDACTRAKYCSWCFITSTCAPLGTCHECAEMKSISQCRVYSHACAWCQDENACKVADSECTKCANFDNLTCDTNAYCHFCSGGSNKGCISRSLQCSAESGSKRTQTVIIVASSLAGIVLLVILLIIGVFLSNRSSKNAAKYRPVGDIDSDSGFSKGKAPLLINDDTVPLGPNTPHYVSLGYANPADFAKAPPEVSAQDIAAEAASAPNLNAALREAGFTETQTATLMAAALDKAARAAGAGSDLSQEEAMALAILAYDIEEGELAGDENPFNLINAALRDGSVQSVAPVRSVVSIIMRALGKLTPVSDATVYHGVATKFLFDRNTTLSWPEFMCTCGNMEAVKGAMVVDGGKVTGTIFTISNAKGYDLSSYSFSGQDAQEIFLVPGAQFKVVDISSSLDLNIINLEMVN